jgi:hypothetical protein
VKLVYVAGPYSAPTAAERVHNVHRAMVLGAAVARHGGMPVVPHLMTRGIEGVAAEEFWIRGTMAVLGRCDAVVLVEGWKRSVGSVDEVAAAMRIGIPVFENELDLARWLHGEG